MINNVKLKSNILLKKEKSKKNNDIHDFIKQSYKYLKIEHRDLFYTISDCNYLINKGYIKEAKELFKIIVNLNNNKYNVQINYLQNKLNEIKFEQQMSKEDVKNYTLCMEFGRYYLEEEKYEDALKYFIKGLHLTNHNIFNYYIGKTYYKLGIYDYAINYFEKYYNKGTYKIGKCTLYLCRAYKYTSTNHEIRNKNFINRNNNLLQKCLNISLLGDYEFVLDNLFMSDRTKLKQNKR